MERGHSAGLIKSKINNDGSVGIFPALLSLIDTKFIEGGFLLCI